MDNLEWKKAYLHSQYTCRAQAGFQSRPSSPPLKRLGEASSVELVTQGPTGLQALPRLKLSLRLHCTQGLRPTVVQIYLRHVHLLLLLRRLLHKSGMFLLEWTGLLPPLPGI